VNGCARGGSEGVKRCAIDVFGDDWMMEEGDACAYGGGKYEPCPTEPEAGDEACAGGMDPRDKLRARWGLEPIRPIDSLAYPDPGRPLVRECSLSLL
jgi:hypothetical protein